MIIQAVISIIFLSLLVKLNKHITIAEAKINNEKNLSKHLQQVLKNINDEMTEENKIAIKNTYIDTVKKRIETDTQKKSVKNNYPKPDNKTDSFKIPNRSLNYDTNVVKNNDTKIDIYQGKFTNPIRLSNAVHISEVSVLLLIKSGSAKQSKDIKVEIKMLENDDNANSSNKQISFSRLKAQVNADNMVSCLFKELPAPPLDKYGFPSYQRNLTLALTGSLNNTFLDCFVLWNETSGRPLNAKFKIPISVIK